MASDVLHTRQHQSADAFFPEKRRTWIYEVPLVYTHRLRTLLNVSAAPLRVDELRRFDLPVIAGCVKVRMDLAVAFLGFATELNGTSAIPSRASSVLNPFNIICGLQGCVSQW